MLPGPRTFAGKTDMTKITVSYRRSDSDAITGRIVDRLVAHYGADSVFRDIDNIPPGIDYRKYISGALASTDILLAIVGPKWAGKTLDGNTRIQQVSDLVRIEVEMALRKDISVVPVLLGNATMPQPSDLPDGLQDFAYRNAAKVDALEDFDDHVARLIRNLDRLLQTKTSTAQQETKQPAASTDASKVAAVTTPNPRSQPDGGGIIITNSKVDTGGGDIVGKDKVQYNFPPQLEHIFQPITWAIDAAAPAQKTEAAEKLRALKAEAANGKSADDSVVAKLVEGLVDLVPSLDFHGSESP
jgi:TIR domain